MHPRKLLEINLSQAAGIGAAKAQVITGRRVAYKLSKNAQH
jgi:hypothetical protein